MQQAKCFQTVWQIAGMVEHPREYRGRVIGIMPWVVTTNWLRSMLLHQQLRRQETKKLSAYRQLFRVALGKTDLRAIGEVKNKAWVLGNDRFLEKIEQLSGRRTKPKARGRPRKTDD